MCVKFQIDISKTEELVRVYTDEHANFVQGIIRLVYIQASGSMGFTRLNSNSFEIWIVIVCAIIIRT